MKTEEDYVCYYYYVRSGCLAVHRLLTVHQLVRVSVSLRVKFKVMVRDMVKLKFMDMLSCTVKQQHPIYPTMSMYVSFFVGAYVNI